MDWYLEGLEMIVLLFCSLFVESLVKNILSIEDDEISFCRNDVLNVRPGRDGTDKGKVSMCR